MAKIRLYVITLFLLCFTNILIAETLPSVETPNTLSGNNVLIITKKHDALSKRIANYYAQQRHVPSEQIIELSIPNTDIIKPTQFSVLQKQINSALTSQIKVILLTFNTPYRVGCMSITSAFAFGFDNKYCGQKPSNSKACNPTAISPYFNDSDNSLWQPSPPLRLSMMLSAKTWLHAKAVIDGGVAADNSYPTGHAYLVKTYDRARSTRVPMFKQLAEYWQDKTHLNIHFIDDSDKRDDTSIKDKKDVLFYHTGLAYVPDIASNHYLPGAIADHLTSGAGVGINHHGQMKAFRWLEAGVTGSYGAVIEPCNFPQKFPNPKILIPNYLNGDTLIEAYWKSVQQPGEGLFIGEPLARPWSRH